MRPSAGGLTLLNYPESLPAQFCSSRYTFYYALFYPFLTYDIVVWGATYENLLKPVLTAQKKVIRAITCTFSEPTAHSSPLFSDLKILTLGDIYQP